MEFSLDENKATDVDFMSRKCFLFQNTRPVIIKTKVRIPLRIRKSQQKIGSAAKMQNHQAIERKPIKEGCIYDNQIHLK